MVILHWNLWLTCDKWLSLKKTALSKVLLYIFNIILYSTESNLKAETRAGSYLGSIEHLTLGTASVRHAHRPPVDCTRMAEILCTLPWTTKQHTDKVLEHNCFLSCKCNIWRSISWTYEKWLEYEMLWCCEIWFYSQNNISQHILQSCILFIKKTDHKLMKRRRVYSTIKLTFFHIAILSVGLDYSHLWGKKRVWTN